MTDRSPWGTYKAVADQLRTRLPDHGALLPSEAAIGAEYGVARTTVRRALASLAEEGLIHSRPGTGWVAGAGEAVAEYQRVAGALRSRITGGELPLGAALPSEAAIAAEFGVSRGTARHALSELEGAGLVRTVHGKGRYVYRK